MIPDLNWWGRLLGLLAVEAALLVAVSALAAHVVRRPQVQRVIWQSCLFAVALVWLGELAGLRGQFGKLHAVMEEPRRQLVVTLAETPVANPLPAQTTFEFPEEAPMVTPPRPSLPVWWPGALWLLGLAALVLKAVVVRGLLAFRTRSSRRKEALTSNSAFRTPHSAFDQSLVTSAATQVVIARLREQLRLGPVRVQVWPQLRGPVAFGVWRPTVALPADFETRFTPKQREAMLAHELAHLAGRDPLWLALADAVCALAWWHPAVWWARRQLRAASEAAADEASALVPDGRAALAESLVAFGRELTSPGPARGLGVSGSGLRSELSRRVTALLAGGPGWTRLNALRRWTVRLAGLTGALGLAVAPFSFNQSASALALLAEATRKAAQLDDASSSPLPSPANAQPRNSDGNSTALPPNWNKSVGANIGLGYSLPDLSDPRSRFFPEPLFSTEPISRSTNPISGTKWVYVIQTNQAKPATSTTTMTLHSSGEGWPLDFENGVREAATPAGRAKFQQIIAMMEEQIAKRNLLMADAKGARLVALRSETDLFLERKARLESYLVAARASQPSTNSAVNPSTGSAAGLGNSAPATPLVTRSFQVDADKFLARVMQPRVSGSVDSMADAVERIDKLPNRSLTLGGPEPANSVVAPGVLPPATLALPLTSYGATGVARTNLMANIQPAIREFFRAEGVVFPIPEPIPNPVTAIGAVPSITPPQNQPAVFFNDRTGVLFVRVTADDMKKVEHALADFGTAPVVSSNLRDGYELALQAMKQADLDSGPIIARHGRDSAQAAEAQQRYRNAKERVALFERAFAADTELELRRMRHKDQHPRVIEARRLVDELLEIMQVKPLTGRDLSPTEKERARKQGLETVISEIEHALELDGKQTEEVRQQLAEGKGDREELEKQLAVLTDNEASNRARLPELKAGLELLRTPNEEWDPRMSEALQQLERLAAAAPRVRTETATTHTSSVTLEIQFAEITEGGGDDIGLDWLFGQSATNNPAPQTGSVTNLPGQTQPQPGSRLQVERLVTEGQSATLTPAQFDALLGKLKQRHGVDLLAAPKVTTLSGRQAQVAVSEVRTLVTDVKTTPGSPTNKAGINYQTESVPVGPVVDILPQAEGDNWRLTVTASLTEFLGYDDPGKAGELKVSNPGGKPVRGTTPLPRLRVRETQATPLAKSGETVVLRGPLVSDTVRFKDKVPVLGDIPVLGRPFRSEGTSTVRKRLYVFVTPVTETRP